MPPAASQSAASESRQEPRHATPRSTTEARTPSTASSEDEPIWPTAESESAAIGETIAQDSGADVPIRDEEEEETNRDIPPLATLVEAIPPTVKETLDDLFRAKFSRAIRVRKKDLI